MHRNPRHHDPDLLWAASERAYREALDAHSWAVAAAYKHLRLEIDRALQLLDRGLLTKHERVASRVAERADAICREVEEHMQTLEVRAEQLAQIQKKIVEARSALLALKTKLERKDESPPFSR
jgi:hypothetical protein